jgi:UDP-glucose 4-epimerase
MNSQQVLDSYANEVVLVTGGAGCIGSNLTKVLLKADVSQLVILDDLSASYEWNIPKDTRLSFIKGSILDEGALKQAFSHKPSYVFHLAAHFANQNSVDHPEADLAVNGTGTLRVLQASRETGVKRTVYASSGCSVYGSSAPLPLKEDFVSIHLDTPYQIDKLVGELYCNYFNDYYKLPVAIARYFNVYGPGEVPGLYRNVIPNFTFWAMKGQPLSITGTGDETRDFTFVDDIVDGTLRLGVIPDAVGEAFNLASEKETKVIDLAKWVNETTKNQAGITFKAKRNWDKSSRRRASISKAKRILGYSPAAEVRDSIKVVHKWFLDNWENINASAKF